MTVGDAVPDLAFVRTDGIAVRLGDYLASDYLLVVLLRHLA